MTQAILISFVAQDRPGVIDQVSAVVNECGGNWLESRMAHLAETFAGVVRVSVPDGKAERLQQQLSGLEDEGFQIMIRTVGAEVAAPGGALLDVEIVGPDAPGIVHEITHALATLGVSVEEMDSRIEGAPHGGGMLFYASLSARLPKGLSGDDFRDALESHAAALTVDLSINED